MLIEPENYILQFTDSLTGRSCALRVDCEATQLTTAQIADEYLNRCPIENLLKNRRITEQSAANLTTLQDLVYQISDSGQLGSVNRGIIFKQQSSVAPPDLPPTLDITYLDGKKISIMDITIDRTNVRYDRNWIGFHQRRWTRGRNVFERFVADAVKSTHSEQETNAILELSSNEHKISLIRTLASKIWESKFENYSRFIGEKIRFKTGDETVGNIISGNGGICSEKVQALKFLTDHYGLPSEYLIAGPNTPHPVPESKLRYLLETFEFGFSQRIMRYWDHTALLYTLGDTTILVDATNGNIPFLFLQDESAHRLLNYSDKQPLRVRMTMRDEDFYYHRVSQDIPENLFFALEGWIDDADLMQVFENELGLYISENWFVTPAIFRTTAEQDGIKRRYMSVCQAAGLEFGMDNNWTLDTQVAQAFQEQEPDISEKILLSEDHLMTRYDQWDPGTHQASLVTIALNKNPSLNE